MAPAVAVSPYARVFAALATDDRVRVVTALGSGCAEARAVMDAAGLSKRVVYDALERLVSAGLVTRVVDQQRPYGLVSEWYLTQFAADLLTRVFEELQEVPVAGADDGDTASAPLGGPVRMNGTGLDELVARGAR